MQLGDQRPSSEATEATAQIQTPRQTEIISTDTNTGLPSSLTRVYRGLDRLSARLAGLSTNDNITQPIATGPLYEQRPKSRPRSIVHWTAPSSADILTTPPGTPPTQITAAHSAATTSTPSAASQISSPPTSLADEAGDVPPIVTSTPSLLVERSGAQSSTGTRSPTLSRPASCESSQSLPFSASVNSPEVPQQFEYSSLLSHQSRREVPSHLSFYPPASSTNSPTVTSPASTVYSRLPIGHSLYDLSMVSTSPVSTAPAWSHNTITTTSVGTIMSQVPGMSQASASLPASSTGQSNQAQPAVIYRPPVPDSLAPRTFHGLPGENAESWLEMYKLYVRARALTALEEINLFPLFLRDGAADWYQSLQAPTNQDINLTTAAFKLHYAPSVLEKTFDIECVFSRTQQPNERVADYVVAMQKLASQLSSSGEPVQISPDILRSLIMRGLRPHIKRHVVQQNPKTLTEVLNAARAAEISENVGATANDAKMDALMSEMKNLSLRFTPTPALSAVDRRSPTPERRRESETPTLLGKRRVTFTEETGTTKQPAMSKSPVQLRGRGRFFSRRMQGNCRTCQRCGSVACAGGNNCYAVKQNLSCYQCGQRGHVSRMCRTRTPRGRSFQTPRAIDNQNSTQ